MPVKYTLVGLLVVLMGCRAVKYNAHVVSDGANGYLRTYYSPEKARVNPETEGTGIEHCKVQGSDILCTDLAISFPAEGSERREQSDSSKDLPAAAPVPATAKKQAPVKAPAKK